MVLFTSFKCSSVQHHVHFTYHGPIYCKTNNKADYLVIDKLLPRHDRGFPFRSNEDRCVSVPDVSPASMLGWIQTKSGAPPKRCRVVRCHLINVAGPIVRCQVVSSIPPPIHGLQSLEDGPFTWLAAAVSYSQLRWKWWAGFNFFLHVRPPQPKQTGLVQMNEKPCIFTGSPIWFEYSLKLRACAKIC